jgi:release factor glutamine methyltransferase
MRISAALTGSALPSADAEVLLSHILGRDRAWLLGHAEDPLTDDDWAKFSRYVERRRHHEPVAYIIGEQEFYGWKFFVDRRVLIPRPATEGIVRHALKFLENPRDASEEVDEGIVVVTKWKMENGKSKISAVVDVGTGSGCIAVTLALERSDLAIIATDSSKDALEVAAINADRHGVSNRITFLQGRGLEPVKNLTEPFLLVSNPPYIPSGNALMPDVAQFEPHEALFGGARGDEIVSALMRQAQEHPQCCGFVMERMT